MPSVHEIEALDRAAAEDRRRVTRLIGPFASRYRDFAAGVRADLAKLPDADLADAKRLGGAVFHADPAQFPSEIREVGRVVEVAAAVLLDQRRAGVR